MRYPAISPDGSRIAFSYKGDIWTVPAAGGRATQLTTHRSYDTQPVWSPDGKTIVFASDRHGNFDLYSVSATGGEPRQLTTVTAAERPITFLNPTTVLYTASIEPDADDLQFPSGQFPQVYSLDITVPGARPRLYSSLPMEDISVSPDGKTLLYHDKKGYEDPWRKHHVSSIARDVWKAEGADRPAKERKFTKLTSFRGEDRNPVWTPDGKSFYYLSEQNGSFNVYRRNLDGSGDTRVTDFTTHPVRNLSGSADGKKLAFLYDGEIYTLGTAAGAKPEKVGISVIADRADYDSTMVVNRSGARSLAFNEKGKEVAFINHGDVYVTSTDYATTKRITDTPEQERNVDFAPDGRSLIYSAERDGRWGIYRTSLVRPEDKKFTYATELKEEPLILLEQNAFQPKFSPDGKEIAFLRDRTELCVYNLDTKQIRTVLPAKYNYSYSDGDQTYAWSPDSRWFLAKYIDNGGWNNTDIVLVKADGSGEMTNLTRSGYSDDSPKWVLDGKAMIWTSDRSGFRSHGSWGAESDVYIMFFDDEAYDNWRLSKEERELAESRKDADKEKDSEKSDKSDKKKSKKADKSDKSDGEAVKPLVFKLDNRDNRVARITPNSSFLGDFILSKDGRKLYYATSFEDDGDLWEHDLDDHSSKIIVKGLGYGEFVPDSKLENLYLIARGGMKKLDLAAKSTKPIEYAAEFTYRPAEEREYIFNHAWRQVADKFYDPAIHGIDWKGYHDSYARFLPYINNNYDFQELLSEMLGELNGSHTGARYYGNMAAISTPATAWLGAFFDNDYEGDGLLVKEIVEQGPMDRASVKIRPGMIIETIDGQPVKAGRDYYPLLSGKAGKQVMLTVKDPATGKTFEQQIKAAGSRSGYLYNRWVERNRAMVDSLSGGRVGYIHIQGMDSPSFRKTFSELLGRYRNADAVIIDTRHNGGGWLHEDLAVLFSGTKFATFEPRGQYIGQDPFNRWTKPSCVLMCEDNYSNAHGFPWTYQTLKLGKLIGAPVPGTMTAVWWENQIDPTIVFGIPQVGMRDNQGRWLENLELQPDIEVYNTPEQQLSGYDEQLRTAVKEMLRAADAAKAK